MKRLFFILCVALIANPAMARPDESCRERTAVIDHLSENYSEQPVALGMTSAGGVIELLTSNDGNSWTILMTMPDGKSCLMAEGQNWKRLQKAPKPKGVPI